MRRNRFQPRLIFKRQERVTQVTRPGWQLQSSLPQTEFTLTIYWSQHGGLCYSVDLCEDARPFAPYMSYGSRATQARP